MAAASLSQSRALAGCKAMTMVERKQAVKQVTNGAKYFMRRRDSFMVEVNVAETETEDQAVKRYMRAVVQSGVINKLRARRHKETKIETYKRKLAERAQARKLGIEEPTWEEFYGQDRLDEAHPFDEFFVKPGDEMEALQDTDLNAQWLSLENPTDLYGLNGNGMYDLSGYDQQLYEQGGYLPQAGAGVADYTQQQGYLPQQQQQGMAQ